MSAGRNALISLARSAVAERLYGDLEYYMEKTTDRCVLITKLCSFIEENEREWTAKVAAKDVEIAALKEQNNRLVDRIINGRPSQTQPEQTPNPTSGT